MANACLHLLDHYDGPERVNGGAGSTRASSTLRGLIAEATNFEGASEWDVAEPDGTRQELLVVTKLREAGWGARIRVV